MNMLEQKMSVIDLKSILSILCYYSHSVINLDKGVANEYWKNDFRSSHGFFTITQISQMCQTLSRQLQNQKLFLLRPIFVHGLCSTNLSRKFARYRNLPSVNEKQIISYGHSKQNLSQHFSRCQRKSRLAYLRRLCASLNSYCQRLISQRRFWCRIRKHRLCTGCNHDRFMPLVIPLGTISQKQSRNQAAYASGSAWQHSNIYRNNRSSFARCQYSRYYRRRTRIFLCYGSILCRFCQTLFLEYRWRFFVVRAKKNLKFRRLYSRKVDKSTGLRCDQTIVLTNSFKDYPEKLRRIRFFDSENKKHLIFLTNNFSLPALTIAQLYKYRWQIELFFKWIKQHLRIKSFFGTSENAVKTQIWIAVSVYVLVAIIKKRLNIKHSLYTILQVLSVTAFEKAPITQVLKDFTETDVTIQDDKQLYFDF